MRSYLYTINWMAALKVATKNISRMRGDSSKCSTAAFTLRDIDRVVAIANNTNDSNEWLGVFHLRDGRYVFVFAAKRVNWKHPESTGYCLVSCDLRLLVNLGLDSKQRDCLELEVREIRIARSLALAS
jgi:hypothetical protein